MIDVRLPSLVVKLQLKSEMKTLELASACKCKCESIERETTECFQLGASACHSTCRGVRVHERWKSHRSTYIWNNFLFPCINAHVERVILRGIRLIFSLTELSSLCVCAAVTNASSGRRSLFPANSFIAPVVLHTCNLRHHNVPLEDKGGNVSALERKYPCRKSHKSMHERTNSNRSSHKSQF